MVRLASIRSLIRRRKRRKHKVTDHSLMIHECPRPIICCIMSHHTPTQEITQIQQSNNPTVQLTAVSCVIRYPNGRRLLPRMTDRARPNSAAGPYEAIAHPPSGSTVPTGFGVVPCPGFSLRGASSTFSCINLSCLFSIWLRYFAIPQPRKWVGLWLFCIQCSKFPRGWPSWQGQMMLL